MQTATLVHTPAAPAPKLDPDQTEVTVDGETLTAEPVSGDQDV